MSIRGGKVKQEKKILLLVLYILKKKHGFAHVRKSHALRFIQTKGLMNIPSEEQEMRNRSETVWENDLAWKRQDLVDAGLMRMKEHDAWEISEQGLESVETWALKILNFTEGRPEWKKDWDGMTEDDIYLNPVAIEWLIKVARKEI